RPAAARSAVPTWRTSSAPRSPRPPTSASARPSPTDSRHRPGSDPGPSLRPQPREIVMASTPPDIGQPTREARTGREDRGQRGNKWWTLVAVCLGTFMLLLDITIVNVALPDIQRALHSSFADLQWVI